MYSTLITPEQLHTLQQSGAPLMVFDCSFDLANPPLGEAQFAEVHIPGAVYVHLDRHLSAHDKASGVSGGRHPLPQREDFARTLQELGFSNQMQAVVYDRNGCNYCVRMWWMLQWLGHEAIAVLDGGLQGWQAAGYAIEAGISGATVPAATAFEIGDSKVELVARQEVVQGLDDPGCILVDSRGAPRYRGDVEPMDPVAGHIPGALNRPFTDNLGSDGRFKPAQVLRQEFDALLQGCNCQQVTVYCGSGVSATPNVLAMRIAGLPPVRLYAGSWSDWCSAHPPLPAERG